jgi:hypothetical protein
MIDVIFMFFLSNVDAKLERKFPFLGGGNRVF